MPVIQWLFTGVELGHSTSVCRATDQEWYEKLPSLPSMIFENQYSLKKLKVRTDKLWNMHCIFISCYGWVPE